MRSLLPVTLLVVGCGGATPPTTSASAPPASATAPATASAAPATAPAAPSSPPPPQSTAAASSPPRTPAAPEEWTPARYVEQLRRSEKEDHLGRAFLGRAAMISLSELAAGRDKVVEKSAAAMANAQLDESQKQRIGLAFASEAPGAAALDEACGAPVSAAVAKLVKAGTPKRDALVKAIAPCKLESRFGLSAADMAKVPIGPALVALASLQLLSKTSKDPAAEGTLAKAAIWSGSDSK